jgi:hypothetical protein
MSDKSQTPTVDRQMAAELVTRAQADEIGEGRLLAQLTKLVLESSPQGELDAHLGYRKHDPAGRVEVPRDRARRGAM